MAAIFYLSFTLTSESSHTSFAMLADLENVGIAFGISLLSYIYKLRYFKYEVRHLGFSTSGSFPFGCTLLQLFPLDGWIPKT